MPELPEVEVCRRDLARWTRDRRIVEVEVPDPAVVRARLSTNPADAAPDGGERVRSLLIGASTAALRRHGKRIGWLLADRDEALLLHLGMTGVWRRRPADEPAGRARLVLGLDDGAALVFEDSRRFGCIVPVARDTLDQELRRGMGRDALLDPLDAADLRAALTGRRPVKIALMDQAVLGGIGNIHASEALWRARVDPATPAALVADEAVARLATVIPAQLQEFVDRMDGHEHVYVTQGGDNPFDVYDREGEPCPRCGAPIARAVHGGRSTFWCAACQPGVAAPGGSR